MVWEKPYPNIDADIEPFWNKLREHEFTLMQCMVCQDYYWPATYCRKHASKPFFGDMAWTPASGKGKVFAFNIHHWAFHPGFRAEVPYVYALVELDEGPMFATRIVGCEPTDVFIGMPVEISYLDVEGEDFTMPYFAPQGNTLIRS